MTAIADILPHTTKEGFDAEMLLKKKHELLNNGLQQRSLTRYTPSEIKKYSGSTILQPDFSSLASCTSSWSGWQGAIHAVKKHTQHPVFVELLPALLLVLEGASPKPHCA